MHWKHHQTDEHRIHGTYNSLDEAMESIYEWWELNEFDPPYIRHWTIDGKTTIDYGHHHIFYYIYEQEESN
ncbi:hypothetical protein LFLEISCH_10759 [Listeria fleischmannii subsp. fleischmannii LU2006-1]|nr:hypothetical protein LFLEISCH_10759 [Listeria fleischmannii subsp. fleischmannii LU2006-1]